MKADDEMENRVVDYSEPTDSEALSVSPGSLLMFVDESGHVDLRATPMFAFGGCSCRADDYLVAIQGPWGRMIDREFRGLPHLVHASSRAVKRSTRRQAAILQVFREQPFRRFAAGIRASSSIPSDQTLIVSALDALYLKLCQSLSAFGDVLRAHVIIEENITHKAAIEAHLNTDLRNQGSGHLVPTHYHWMPKTAYEPGLQVADFVAHATFRQLAEKESSRRPYTDPDPLFAAVFQSVPREYVSFVDVERLSEG